MNLVITPRLSISGSSPSVVRPSGTTTNFFPGGNSSSPGIPAGANSISNGYIAPGNLSNGQIIHVKAAGDIFFSGDFISPNVTVGLYPVTITNPNNSGTVTIGATPIVSQTSTFASETNDPFPWALSVDLQGSTFSGLLQAVWGYITIDGVAGSFSPSLPMSGINFNNSVPFALVTGVSFSFNVGGNANHVANMYEFSLDY